MRPISIPLSLAFCHVAQAHCKWHPLRMESFAYLSRDFWGRLIVNDTITPTWQYVRSVLHDRVNSRRVNLTSTT